MTPEQLIIKLLVSVLEKLQQVPGVATYDEDVELLKEAERHLPTE